MSAVPLLLLIAFLAFGYLQHWANEQRIARIKAAHKSELEQQGEWKNVARGWEIAANACSSALQFERAKVCALRGDPEWARVVIATQAAPEYRADILAAHRDLAPVVPIGGRG